MTLFVKRYADADRAARARDNYFWLASINSGVLLPELVCANERTLTFTRLSGTAPRHRHLAELADVIGRMQSAAKQTLAGARLNHPHELGQLTIGDFTESRREPLHQTATRHGISPHWIDDVLGGAVALKPAFYKDSNLRNFILTGHGVAVVDFDDLTLAPHGYDLAKLIVSMAMTFGHVSVADAATAVERYNAAVGYIACTPRDLAIWAELNWLLTADYLGRNGYEYAWPDVRPWASPFRP